MPDYSFSEVYLAYRQAKVALYFERRGVGFIDLAEYEANLRRSLLASRDLVNSGASIFEGMDGGKVWLVPKRHVRHVPPDAYTVYIGPKVPGGPRGTLEVQVRLQPSPTLAIAEVLFLTRFGAALDSLLTKSAVGYRLDAKDGRISPTRRWLFEYWPVAYEEFRTAPVQAALRYLRRGGESITILSADLTSFYDSIDSSFLSAPAFVSRLMERMGDEAQPAFDEGAYLQEVESLQRFHREYRARAAHLTGVPWTTGIPIGALTSRLVGNLALASLDEWILGQDSTVSYRRYVDDFVIASGDLALPGRERPAVLEALLPMQVASGVASPQAGHRPGLLRLDETELERQGSSLVIQPDKLRIHHLSGAAGVQFLESVSHDFLELVSDRRAFIDDNTLLEDAVTHLSRTQQRDGSPIRAFRDADRVRLERFALSTSLASLERISVLVDARSAREAARATQERISEVLDRDAEWLSEFELAFRLLRLSLACDDPEIVEVSLRRMERLWSEPSSLQRQVSSLTYRGEAIRGDEGWSSVVEYLHARQFETISAAVLSTWLQFPDRRPALGLRYRGQLVGWDDVARVAHLLANADVRARDREDDSLQTADDFDEAAFESLVDDDLRGRLKLIAAFVLLCRALGERSWVQPGPLLFLSPRPPSYFDVARRWLSRIGRDHLKPDSFSTLLDTVNALRGTEYTNPVADVVDEATAQIAGNDFVLVTEGRAHLEPRVVLCNLTVEKPYWVGAATRRPGASTGSPVLTFERLGRLAAVLKKAKAAGRSPAAGPRRPSLIILPELSLPRAWLRDVAMRVAGKWRMGLIAGLEYAHDPAKPYVINQAMGVFPGPLRSVAAWMWTKEAPAREERVLLARMQPSVSFEPARPSATRLVVRTEYGNLSVLICSELLEARRVAELLGRVELVVVPAWNTDTASYDHLVQSVGLQLHSVVAIANNGEFSDCRAWAPRHERWERDLCRLIARGEDEIAYVDIPLDALRAFHASGGARPKKKWRPLPPSWP